MINLRSVKDEKIFDTSLEYWNNTEMEKKKVFSSSKKLENDMQHNSFIDELKKIISDSSTEKKSLMSIGCGVFWIESKILSFFPTIQRAVGIDFSRHRIHQLAPKYIKELAVNDRQIDLYFGDVFDFRIDEKFDIIYLSKAFHHVHSPMMLLSKLRDYLNENGVIIISGEHLLSSIDYAKRVLFHLVKYILRKDYRSKNSLLPEYSMLFPHSFEKGDFHYSNYTYSLMYRKMGFKFQRITHKELGFQTFVLIKGQYD